MTLASLVLGAVTLGRLFELALARRNTRALLARGAREVAPVHYGAIVALHAAWLASLWVFGRTAPVSPGWLSVFWVLQALRIWVLTSLGPRWTTRIVILPGAPLIDAGPYRWLRHPNYAVVVAEVAVLPLALGLAAVAALFTPFNLGILWVRVRAEDRALVNLRP